MIDFKVEYTDGTSEIVHAVLWTLAANGFIEFRDDSSPRKALCAINPQYVKAIRYGGPRNQFDRAVSSLDTVIDGLKK